MLRKVVLGFAVSALMVACGTSESTIQSTTELGKCYQLSDTPGRFSRSPDQLCINENNSQAIVTTTHGFPAIAADKNVFKLNHRVRCFDCNRDIWTFESLIDGEKITETIEFEGEKQFNPTGGFTETGRVLLDGRVHFYRYIR